VVAQVAVQLHARSIRRAGCMTRGRGLPRRACWESEKCAHLARLHAACMAARPFARWSGQKWRVACNRWAVVRVAHGGLASSASEPACMTCGTQPPRRRRRTLECAGEDSARDGWGRKQGESPLKGG
jgi:hypothetical protein